MVSKMHITIYKGGSSRPSWGGGNWARGPNLGYPQNWKLHGFNPLFLGMNPNSLLKKGKYKKTFWELWCPLPGLGGMAGLPPPPGSASAPVETNQTNQAISSVRKFVYLCGRRHPVVNNFPLSHVIFKVNFPLSNDPLALVSAKSQQQHFNGSLSQVKDLELSLAMNSSVFNYLADSGVIDLWRRIAYGDVPLWPWLVAVRLPNEAKWSWWVKLFLSTL